MLLVMKGKDWVTFLETLGFLVIRQKESHNQMKSDGGRSEPSGIHKIMGKPGKFLPDSLPGRK
jgi:predicted RNA binding protein YcfA (HicA-like mRNA interferase family)